MGVGVAAAAVPALMAASTVLQLIGGQQESEAKQAQAKANQDLANRAAADAYARGSREAGLSRMQGSDVVAQQQVGFANSGVDPTVGTPANVMASTRATAELDALTRENNAAREAWGFKTHGAQFGQVAAYEAQSQPFRQASTVLGAAGRFASYKSKPDASGYGGGGY